MGGLADLYRPSTNVEVRPDSSTYWLGRQNAYDVADQNQNEALWQALDKSRPYNQFVDLAYPTTPAPVMQFDAPANAKPQGKVYSPETNPQDAALADQIGALMAPMYGKPAAYQACRDRPLAAIEFRRHIAPMAWRILTALALGVALLASLPGGASAATFRLAGLKKLHPEKGSLVIFLNGVIEQGDAARLSAMLNEARTSPRPLFGVRLNSPGGDLFEGMAIGETIRRAGLTIMVDEGEMCASACFLALAAGDMRILRGGARIGVHGAAENGVETPLATKGTITMARIVSDYGVPPSIIGRMVVTPPDKMVWLTNDEIRTLAGNGYMLPSTP